MDESEKLVEAYLKCIGFTDVSYEPDGNIPPDFSADSKVAVEVRRLNQNYDDGTGRIRGLEEAAIPLWQRVREYLLELSPSWDGSESWYVFYRFHRPIPNWKNLKRQLDDLLIPFMSNPDRKSFETRLSKAFRIQLFRASAPKSTFFVPAGHSDQQSGGWLLSEMDTNLKHCIEEKTAKIRNYRTRYPSWWLVLPDHIGLGLDDFDRELFAKEITVKPGGFDRIVLVDPRNASRSFTVYP
jgi:hypothetical protein